VGSKEGVGRAAAPEEEDGMRKIMFFVVPVALVAFFAVSAIPVGAAPGAGSGVQTVSPKLDGHNGLDGFPCAGGGGAAFDALSQFLGLAKPSPYTCTGTLYPNPPVLPDSASFFGSGVQSDGTPYALSGLLGTINGAYTYSEPCQSTPTGDAALTGEAQGTLTSDIPNATGMIGATPVTEAQVTVDFWWSRVLLNAVVGVRNITITYNNGAGTLVDPAAEGLAVAVFVPAKQPVCGSPYQPAPGDINILSGTITVGSP